MLRKSLVLLIVIALVIFTSLILFTDFHVKNELIFFLDDNDLILIFEEIFFNPLILTTFLFLLLVSFLILINFIFLREFYLKENIPHFNLLTKNSSRSPPQFR